MSNQDALRACAGRCLGALAAITLVAFLPTLDARGEPSRSADHLSSVPEAPAADSVSGNVTVGTHSDAEGHELKVLSQAARLFNSTPGRPKVEILLSTTDYQYEDEARSAAVTGTLPCLLDVDSPYVSEFAWAGYLQSLDSFVPRELRSDLLPSVLAQGTYNGHLYGLGQFDSGLGLWANRRHLRAAHVRIPTVAAPWSLAEFEQALEKLAAVKGVHYPLYLLFDTTSEFKPYAYAPILQGFGGDLIDRKDFSSARGVLDGPQSVAAMKRVQYWLQRGWTRPDADPEDFANRRTALSWSGHWKYPAYHHALGADLVLLPLPDFGRGIKTATGSWTYGITSTCRNPTGAWAFLAFLMSKREIARISRANGGIPARRSVLAHSPLYGDGGPLRVFAQQLEAGLGVPRPATPAYHTISRSFSDAFGSIVDGEDVQAALTMAASTIDADIARNRGYPPEPWESAAPSRGEGEGGRAAP
jgi:multiple sugar transport system substrate-binding protein